MNLTTDYSPYLVIIMIGVCLSKLDAVVFINGRLRILNFVVVVLFDIKDGPEIQYDNSIQ